MTSNIYIVIKKLLFLIEIPLIEVSAGPPDETIQGPIFHSAGTNFGRAGLYVFSLRYYRVIVCLFDLILYVPVNNFTVMSGQVFLG